MKIQNVEKIFKKCTENACVNFRKENFFMSKMSKLGLTFGAKKKIT